MNLIQKLEQEEIQRFKAKPIDDFRVGDTVKVHCNVVEGTKSRVQIFEGIVLYRKGSGVNESLCVRKIGVGGVGVERVFPLYSPTVARIERVRQGKARRARLYYLRDRVGKAARVRERSVIVKRGEKAGAKAKKSKDTAAAAEAPAEA